MAFDLRAQHSTLDKERTNSNLYTAAASIVNSIQLLTYKNYLAERNLTNVIASGDSSHFLLVS